jgi:drug/metabolite transporter (DMT)-like permease
MVTLPLAIGGRLRATRQTAPLIAIAAVCEVAGLAAFVVGSRDGIAVSVVIASQYAALATIAAFVLFRERLAPLQVAGVAAIVCGVAALGALQA